MPDVYPKASLFPLLVAVHVMLTRTKHLFNNRAELLQVLAVHVLLFVGAVVHVGQAVDGRLEPNL